MTQEDKQALRLQYEQWEKEETLCFVHDLAKIPTVMKTDYDHQVIVLTPNEKVICTKYHLQPTIQQSMTTPSINVSMRFCKSININPPIRDSTVRALYEWLKVYAEYQLDKLDKESICGKPSEN